MLNLIEIKPEHKVMLGVLVQKINELYLMHSLFEDSPDKFYAQYAIESAALWMNKLIINGKPQAPNLPVVEPKADSDIQTSPNEQDPA